MQRRHERSRKTSLFLVVFAALQVPIHAQTWLPVEVLASSRRSDQAPRHLPLLRVLDELPVEAFDQGAAELCATVDPAALDALILRAGTPVPPGLPEAVQNRREASRTRALEWVRARVEESGATNPWLARLTALLAEDPGEARWCAAASTAASLGCYELATAIAPSLADGSAPRRRETARAALHVLYRRWFESTADFDRFYERARGLGRAELFLDELQTEQQEALGLHLRLIELEPQREGIAALVHPDPTLRVRAARALRRGVGEGRVAAEEAIEALFARLANEHDARALRAILDSLLQLLTSSPADSPLVARLRDLLVHIGDSGQHDLEWPVLESLAHLPWAREQSEGPASLVAGLTRVNTLFRAIALESEVPDSDVLVQVIDAWRNLRAPHAGDAPRPVGLTLPAREAVRYLLTEAEIGPSARLAAATCVALVLPADPIEATSEIVALVERVHGQPELEVELLGALETSRAALPPGHPMAGRLRRILLDRISHESAALRGRALECLAGAAARGELDSQAVDALVARLDVEPVLDLRLRILDALAATRQPDLADRVLRMNGLEDLLVGDARRVQAVAVALRTMAGSDPGRVLRCADRLVAAKDPETRTERLEQALAAVIALGPDAARRIPDSEHRSVLAWAFELRERAGLRPIESHTLVQVLGQLVDVHARRALTDSTIDPRSLAHAVAVLAGDLALASDPPGDIQPALVQFAAAIAWASEQGDGARAAERLEVLRDRARFLCAAGLPREALADYRVLLAEIPLTTPALVEGEAIFQLADLRRTANLLVDPALGNDQDPKAAALACQVGLALVRQESWQKLPPQTRIQDLRDLADRARICGNRDHLTAARAIFDDLPDLPPPGEDPLGTNGTPETNALWRGLLRDRNWHEALLELRTRLRSTSAADTHNGGKQPTISRPGPRSPHRNP